MSFWHRAARPATAIAAVIVIVSVGATVAFGGRAHGGVLAIAALGWSLVGGLLALIALGVAAAAHGAAPRRQRVQGAVARLPGAHALRAHLERWLSAGDHERRVLFVFALDGFKGYNEMYGEPCGDALLAWLAGKLAHAVEGRGAAYRLRGAAFAVLATGAPEQTTGVRAEASAALFEIGDGFEIWASVGEAELSESRSAEEALERADRRARAAPERRAEPDVHAPDDPVELLPLIPPRYDVGELTRRIGRRMGVAEESLDDLEAAAYLRDAGYVAMPSAIFTHGGALPAHEWRFIALHTLVGERLLAARFGMEAAGRLVRSSHERFDGAGYPDGLAGDDIPLGARIIAACGAFEDMTSERPHRPARDNDAALAELASGAGTQFDPAVVTAIRAAFGAETDLVRSVRALRTRHPLRVLLVEAEPVVRFLTRRTALSVGHECIVAGDGLTALDLARSARPEAVIADLSLPGLDGVELCRRIRDDGLAAHCVLLATREQRDHLRAAARRDLPECVVKPINRLDLEVALSRAASAESHRRAARA